MTPGDDRRVLRRLMWTDAAAWVILIRLMVGAVFLSKGIQKFLFPAQLEAGLLPGGIRSRNEMETGPGGRQIQLEDPDGNPIELFEPAR